jgi:hypothetical protein
MRSLAFAALAVAVSSGASIGKTCAAPPQVSRGAAAASAASDASEPVAPDSVLRLVDFAGLARLDSDVVCRQFASTDPSGRGDDHGHYLKLEGHAATLAEMDGPGLIARLWSANASGRLKVFLDGESEPRIDCPFQDLFTGQYPPFVEPIATHRGGGWISYFPIAYAKHCRVVVDELANPGDLYYHVQYLTFPASTKVRTFTRELPESEKVGLAKVLECWREPAKFPIAPSFDEKDGAIRFGGGGSDLRPPPTSAPLRTVGADHFTLKPGGYADVGPHLDCTGSFPTTIELMQIRVAEPTVTKLRGLLLDISFDRATEPSVSAPVADFFGVGFGARPQAGLLVGWDGDHGYCRMPMPFRRNAVVVLKNTTDETITVDLDFVLRGQPAPDFARDGYLHAEYRRIDQVGDDLYEFASVKGAGKFVGVNLTLQGVGDLWYLEGNEQFFVDGETKPSIVGTGTEDFFNGGWYWDSGPFALPLHGLGVKEEWTTNRTTPWRHYLTDAIPFRSGLVARIEHGSSNQVRDASYSSVAFWYAKEPTAVRPVTAEDAHVPRRWVRRPKNAIAAASLKWAPAEAATPTKWEQLSPDLRGCEYPLHQGFPVSFFERDQPKVASELVLLRGREVRAAFVVDDGDRYRSRLHLASRADAPKFELLVDDHSLGVVDVPPPPASITDPRAVEPLLTPPLPPIGLARGQHTLTLRRVDETKRDGASPSAATNVSSDADWIGLDAIVLESASPYVRSWWIAPPVACDPKGTVEEVAAPEPPFLAHDFDPKSAGWKEVPDAGDQADLNRWITPRAPILGYLATYVFAPKATTVTARLGSDDGVRVWCNGRLAWSHAVHRPLTPDADRFDVALDAGWNLLLVKVRNDDGGYALSLRLCDPDGTLKVATRRE